MVFCVGGIRFSEDKHDARMFYSTSIRNSHSANAHRLAEPIGGMPDLTLPLLVPLMATSKHIEHFTRHVGQWWRKDSSWIV